jgi:choline dehydrogenase-like flavoprotein
VAGRHDRLGTDETYQSKQHPKGKLTDGKPAMLQIIRSQKVYDVCIIGSGAAGGGAAKVLTEGGLEVVMLEAGPLLNPAKHFTEHLWPYQLPHRGAGIGGSGYDASGSRELDVAFISGHIPGEPYTNAPGSPFGWDRARILGGRTNHFTRVWLRMAEADFKGRSLDGAGYDWPISYQDLAPYYDKSDAYIGVYGTTEHIPSAPDGIFQPPPLASLLRCDHSKRLQKARYPLHSRTRRYPHPNPEWPRALPLLQPVREGLRNEFEFQLQPNLDSCRIGNRPPDDYSERHGAGNPGGR